MGAGVPNSPGRRSGGFQRIAAAFLAQPGLPFADVLSAERIDEAFGKHRSQCGFGRVFTTSVMVWSFLGQVLRDRKEASCQAAVARVVVYCEEAGIAPPTEDTGDYCRARAKLSEAALSDLSCTVARELEAAAAPSWLWNGLHAKLIDGFTFTMPDTDRNQKEYPQPKTQKPGVGQPIARTVAILSLATAAVLDLAVGPYLGKETGESALLRTILGSLNQNDVAVFDRYYCSFMMIALLRLRGVHVCARLHHLRKTDFRRGRRLGRYDHIVEWARPARPEWMDQATYDAIPTTLQLREIRYDVVAKGRRTKSITVVTTLIDEKQHSKEDIAQVYSYRWNAELDIRSIKESLNLGHLRCKSPAMIRRELWTTILAYNLIRTTAAAAALLHEKQPRQISFTSTCQYVLASWMLYSCRCFDPQRILDRCLTTLKQIAHCEVASRPDRLEPRVVKRRPKPYKLMQNPRNQLRRELRKRCT